MIGWALLLGVALLVAAMIWRWARLPAGLEKLAAAFLVLGLAGYTWQGKPMEPGTPVSAHANAPQNEASVRRFVSARMGPVVETLGYADAWSRAGRPDLAVRVIKLGLKTQPKSADLWLALGSALSSASEGAITPPAQFALAKAASLAPDHPGLLFFQGLRSAQANDIEGAARAWLLLEAQTPEDAPWREDLELRLTALARLVASEGQQPKP
jgi:cytochrome c-type biogenesis protein CcmH